jgi:hypothetical protein
MPISLTILEDKSISASLNKVPELDRQMIDELVDLIQNSGGSLNYLAITDDSFVPILRLDLASVQEKKLKEAARILSKKNRYGNSKAKSASTSVWSVQVFEQISTGPVDD